MPLRAAILSGACICVFAVAFSICLHPAIIALKGTPTFLSVFLAGVLCYVFAAVRWTRIVAQDDFLVLRSGARWGVMIGLAWAAEVVAGNLIVPHQLGARIGVLAAAVAAFLPLFAGLRGAEMTGRVVAGLRVGFWSGIVSGLITFVSLAIVGYLVVLFPGFPGVEVPHEAIAGALTAKELAAFNIGDYLAAGVSHLVLIGAPFCSGVGLVGGLLGRRSPS
jgi:hypothetical protein